MHIWQASIASLIGMSVIMGVLYAIGRQRQNMAVVDLGWTAGVALTTLLFSFLIDGWIVRELIVLALISIWSGRLFFHLLIFRILGEAEEDGRYQYLRQHWGADANRKYFWFFQGQGPLAVLFAVPPILALGNPTVGLTPFDFAGIAVWLVAINGEALADRQLERFRTDPTNRGKVCNVGLWNYSRHPNYFFEWLHWWAYVALCILQPLGWISLLGPVLMYLFLTRLTGIPYTEKRALVSRGEAYRTYQQTTSRFFPWFPRKTS
jgi:steroid 5-alpha reductase family enzyme